MVSLVSNVNELDQIKELIRKALINVYYDVKDSLPYGKVFDFDYKVTIENELVKYMLTVYFRIRCVQCIYLDAIYQSCSESCGEELNEEDIERCVSETLREYNSEYLVKPFEFRYEDTTLEVENDVDMDEDSVKRCYYDVMKVTYKNQLSVDYLKEQIKNEVTKEDMVKKLRNYVADQILATFKQFREILDSLLPN